MLWIVFNIADLVAIMKERDPCPDDAFFLVRESDNRQETEYTN